MLTIRASSQGIKKITQAREQRGWAIDDHRWLVSASQLLEPNNNWQDKDFFADGVSLPTWKRFLTGKKNIKAPAFQAFCSVLKLNWQEIALEEQEPITSSLYIERVPDESQCYKAILQPGSLIQIKAPQQMGKTWLVERLIHHVENMDYEQLLFDFKLGDITVFSNIHKFSQWFCAGVAHQLGLPNKLADYWKDMLSCNYNSTVYFQEYLLAQNASPLVLVLEQVDKVFEHPQIATDFCQLLLSWHEQARRGNRTSKIWQRLRLVVVHSTDVYASLNINHSPLNNVGTVVELQEFSPKQVQDLAQRHGLSWDATKVQQLMDMVGGHPHLVNLALNYIAREKITLEQLLKSAATEAGIYSDHLRCHLKKIKQNPELATALREVVTTPQPVRLESVQAFKLYSMGLVKQSGNYATPGCDLYRQYFRERLSFV